jgi:hypothetical protein
VHWHKVSVRCGALGWSEKMIWIALIMHTASKLAAMYLLCSSQCIPMVLLIKELTSLVCITSELGHVEKQKRRKKNRKKSLRT